MKGSFFSSTMEKMKTKTNERTQIITMTGLPHDFRSSTEDEEVQLQAEDQNLQSLLWNGLENVIHQMRRRVTMKMNKEQNKVRILGGIVWLANEAQGLNQLIREVNHVAFLWLKYWIVLMIILESYRSRRSPSPTKSTRSRRDSIKSNRSKRSISLKSNRSPTPYRPKSKYLDSSFSFTEKKDFLIFFSGASSGSDKSPSPTRSQRRSSFFLP